MEYARSEKKVKKEIMNYIKNELHGLVWPLQERFLIGVPDLFCVVDEKPFFVEVKGPKGRLSPAQDHMLHTLRNHGVKAFVARSVDDVQAGLSRI